MSAAVALPYIERRSPITVTRNAPILNVLQPVSETSLSDGRRNPVDRLIIAHKLISDRRHFDKPGFARIIDQRRITAPAERIIMLKFRRVKQLTFLVEILQDFRVCFFHKQSRIWRLLRHVSFSVNELYERKIVFSSHLRVVLTERRRDMNNTRTVRHRNIRIAGHIVPLLMLLFRHIRRTLK